jgi:phospholipid/cholesterol/gamma-HCH transport system substrate-binding protein
VNDKELYHHLNGSAESLDSLLIDLRKHPKRYVHFSIFGAQDKVEKKK